MICPTCYGASRITRTLDTGTEVTRIHECLSAECDSVWATDQKLRAGSLRTNRRAIKKHRQATNAIAGATAPPGDVASPSVRTNGTGGAGGALSSGSVSIPILAPDPSQQPPQDLPRAGAPDLFWDAREWLRLFGEAWAAARGVQSYGATEADFRAMGKLTATLASLSPTDRLAAQRDAPRIFATFFARAEGKVAQDNHPFYFFAPAFNGLRAPPRVVAPARDVRLGHAQADVTERPTGEVAL